MPEYRERSIGYERFATSLPGPYTQLNASMAGYAFRADGYCLQGVINHYLAGDEEYQADGAQHHVERGAVLTIVATLNRVLEQEATVAG